MAHGATGRRPTTTAPPQFPPPSRVVATAGHVDHGKSTLVRWLTGTDPDRLAEERRRGLTIDLGFASTQLDDGTVVGIVDVPGHIRFLKNMLAGVGAVDACLFVVAATEGWKPQSEDHLRICDLVGIRRGVVALTHAAAAGDARLEAVADDVAARVAGTFLEGAPLVAVDVPAAVGTDGPGSLRDALAQMVAATPPAADRGRPRLWVDRAFAIRGAGTVVTGTLAGGSVSVGDQLAVVSGRDPGGVAARVRGLETYGAQVATADPGRRLAVNLAGLDRHAVGRGAALVRAGQWHRCRVADVEVRVLPAASHALSRRGAYLAHVGTVEQAVRVRVLGRSSELAPGEAGAVRLWLAEPLPLQPGDRLVLRDAGRRELVGGGEVLDVEPVLPATRASPTRSVARVVAERGWVEADELERLTGAPQAPTLGRWVVDPGALEEARKQVEAKVVAAGARGIDVSELDERARAVLGGVPGVRVVHGTARIGDAGAGAAELEGHPYLAALRAAPFTPPPPDGIDRHDLRLLVREGLVVDAGEIWFAASAVALAAARVAGLLEEHPDGVRVADIRDALGASRRYVLALVAHLDATGVTRRRGDLRVGGPRLAAVAGTLPASAPDKERT